MRTGSGAEPVRCACVVPAGMEWHLSRLVSSRLKRSTAFLQKSDTKILVFSVEKNHATQLAVYKHAP